MALTDAVSGDAVACAGGGGGGLRVGGFGVATSTLALAQTLVSPFRSSRGLLVPEIRLTPTEGWTTMITE
jgi:hypothetical protein